VDNSGNIVDNLGALGITCDSIPTKNIQFSPYMGGLKMDTGIFALEGISSSAIELNARIFIPARIHNLLISIKGPDKP
jgi:hypothetical protein